jgi:hypothetical protein
MSVDDTLNTPVDGGWVCACCAGTGTNTLPALAVCERATIPHPAGTAPVAHARTDRARSSVVAEQSPTRWAAA